MRRNWWGRLALILMVVVLGAAACGGDDGGSSEESSGSSDSDTISEDDWLDETADLCEDWVQEVEDVDGTDPDSVADLADSTAAFAEDVDALGAPEGIEDEAADFVGIADDLAGYTQDVADVLEEGDTPDDDLIEDGGDASSDLVDAAEELDLDCDLSIIDERADDTGDLTSDFSDDASSDFSDDFSADFSDDFSDDPFPGDALDPSIFITEFGTDPVLDQLAVDCYEGDLGACDQLYLDSPIDEALASYEGYGATCGGRLAEEQPNNCVAIGG